MIMQHEFHKEKYYYPSNKFLLNSEEEEIFFKNKWSTNVNRVFVKKIYDNFNFQDSCPCKILIAFNVCKAKAFKLDANNFVYNIHFSNEFELKNNFFTKSNKEEVCNKNLDFVKANFPDVYENCIFNNDNCVKNVKKNVKRVKKYKISPKNSNIDVEIETDAQRLMTIANTLEDKNNDNLYQEGLLLYKRLEYYNRFKARLVDENLYVPRTPNNVRFKTTFQRVKQQMFTKAVQFWGVKEIKMQTVGGNIHCVYGQILPPSDNPDSMHTTASCLHANGFQSYYIQIRMADEAMTRVKICNDCKRRIK